MGQQDERESSRLARAIAWLGDTASVADEIARRRRFLIYANFVFIVSAALFGIRRAWTNGLDVTALLLLAAAGAVGVSLATIRILGRHQPALLLTLATAILALGRIAHVNGGLTAPAAAACLSAPLLAVFAGGHLSGLVTTMVTASVLVALFLLSPAVEPSSYIEATRLLAMLGSVAFTFAVARFFEAERRRTAATIARSREDFRRLVDSSRDAVVVVRDGGVVYANAATADLFGFDGDEDLAGRPLLSVIHRDDRDDVAPLLERLLRGEATDQTAEASFHRPDGERVTIVIHQVKNVDFGGDEGLLLVGRDIREKKRLEAQLRMADRLASVGSLAAGVAHEVNNPLTYVMSNLSYALDCHHASLDGVPTDEIEEALTEALDGARRVQRIVSDLQSFSRESTPEQRQVDVRQVLGSAIKMANHEVKHRATLVEDHDQNLPLVWGDEPKLAQLFLNLLINAAQAIPVGQREKNSITVRSRGEGTREAPRLVIEVIDSGSGIDEALFDRIFDPFFTTKPVGEGTGLGLAISHGLVTSMGGQLSLRNNPDGGVTARVELPALTAHAVEASHSMSPVTALPHPRLLEAPLPSMAPPVSVTTPPDSSDTARVLVVDDEPYVGQAIRRMLTPDYEVEVVRRGVDALERLTIDHYVAVLCDVMMPQMSGIDLYEEVARLLPGDEERFVFMTGGAFTNEARAFLAVLEQNGRPRSLLKPFNRDAVVDALERCRGMAAPSGAPEAGRSVA